LVVLAVVQTTRETTLTQKEPNENFSIFFRDDRHCGVVNARLQTMLFVESR